MEREVNNTDTGELAKAFRPQNDSGMSLNRTRKSKRPSVPKWAFGVLALGVVALIVGLVVFIINKNSQPPMEDVDFLMEAGEWQREDQPAVIWDFIGIGGGELTTDGHLNDYAFEWSLENGKLKIQTDWLYDLNDEFDYKIDQGAKTLVITNADKGIEVKFKAKERERKNKEIPVDMPEDVEASEGNEGENNSGE